MSSQIAGSGKPGESSHACPMRMVGGASRATPFELRNLIDYGCVRFAPVAMKLLLTESGLARNEIV